MVEDLVNQLVNRRISLALATILVAIGIGWGVTYTTMDNSSNAILVEGDIYKEEVDQARADFPASESILFTFEALPDIFNMEVLGAIESFTQRYSEIESAIAVTSIINSRLNPSDANRYGRDYLIPDITAVTATDLPEIRAIALADKDLTESILSKDGDMVLAYVRLGKIDDDPAVRLRVAESAIALRDSLREQYPSLGVYAVGNVLFERDGHYASKTDIQVLLPIIIITGILLLWFCLRSIPYALCLFIIAGVTVIVTLGTYSWLGIALNQISRYGPMVVLVVAIADGIHIASVYAQALLSGQDKLDAMKESLRINFQPVALATITTAIGFLSLNYSSSPAIYGFGNVIAIGVVWAFVLTLTLLPSLLLLLPVNKVPQPLGVKHFIDWVGFQVGHRSKPLFWGCLALVAATFAMLPLNKLDFDRYSMVDKSSDGYHVIRALRDKIGNDQSLVYVLRSPDYYGITYPEFLGEVEKFTAWLELQPETSFVNSYTDYLKSRNKADNDDLEEWKVVPDDQLTVIDYLVGYQLIQEIEPMLPPLFNKDYSAARLNIATSNLSNQELLAFADKIDQWVEQNITKGLRVTRGDNSILFARINGLITQELMSGFALSFFFITVTMMVGLRSLRYGLVSIMPNLFPVVIVFGFWGLWVGQLSPYTLMLFSISIGLVVDDSVHILSKYMSARNAGNLPKAAIAYSLDKAGSAITITTLSLAIGTFILVFSNTDIFQNVAKLISPIIIVALLLDLLFLLPLLERLDRWLHPVGDFR